MAKKTDVYVFQKVTPLAPFYESKGAIPPPYAQTATRVNLVLSFGKDDDGNLIAKINCPVNPLPVKGGFRPASKCAVLDFLRKNGWEYVKGLNNKILNM